jgi:VWFA-related protein
MGIRLRVALGGVLVLLLGSAPGRLSVELRRTVHATGSRSVAADQQQQPQQDPQPAPRTRQQGAQGQQPQGQQDAAQQPPVFRTGINFVRVDVIVSDKSGNPVSNLEPPDFEVLEDDKPQKIELFRVIELDGGLMPGPDGPPRAIRTDADEETEAARDDVRLFGIFLDEYNVRQGASVAARQSISRFIETQLGPSDMVGLMYPLLPIDSVRFTRNHAAIGKAIQQFLGRKYDFEPRNEMEQRYAHYPTEIVQRIRNEVSLGAIQSLISRMGGLKEGRKALILVSEGYNNMLPPQMRNPNAQMPGIGNPARRDPTAGQDDPNEFRAMAMSTMDMEMQLRDVYDMANRNNVAIYAVDPRGLAGSDFDISDNIADRIGRDYLNASMNTLRTLSLETDGRAIVNRNDLTIAMKQIVLDTSAYYLLGYNSNVAEPDGKFHEIKVRVRRPGVQVRARRGYWAVTREEARRSTSASSAAEPPKAISAALAVVAQPVRSRLIRTWIGTERGQGGRMRVSFVWEPTPPLPGSAPPRASDVPARVSLVVAGADGTPFFRGRVPDAAPSGASPTPGSRVTFDVPPGAMQLRIAVEGADAETLDSETREITIPDLSGGRTAFGTPEVFRARTLPELQRLKADGAARPTPAREFSRTERLFVRAAVYGPDGASPTVTARLLNRSGQPMSGVQVSRGSAGDFEIDLPLAGLAVGDYVLELKAASDGGEAQELVGFRIRG